MNFPFSCKRLPARVESCLKMNGGSVYMSNLPQVFKEMRLPVIAAPLFIISNPKLVIEQCKAGIVGSMPALNARPASQVDEWLAEITETLADYNAKNPDRPAAPWEYGFCPPYTAAPAPAARLSPGRGTQRRSDNFPAASRSETPSRSSRPVSSAPAAR